MVKIAVCHLSGKMERLMALWEKGATESIGAWKIYHSLVNGLHLDPQPGFCAGDN